MALDNCIFCSIVAGASKAFVIYENQWICCFLDIDPISEGHTLIVPKSHVVSIEEFSQEMKLALMDGFEKITKALKAVFKPDGISALQDSGAFDEIGHFHFHVFPRYHQDGFGWKSSTAVDASDSLQLQRQVALSKAIQ